MKATFYNMGDDAPGDTPSREVEAESFQITYTLIRDDADNEIASYDEKVWGAWKLHATGEWFSDVVFST